MLELAFGADLSIFVSQISHGYLQVKIGHALFQSFEANWSFLSRIKKRRQITKGFASVSQQGFRIYKVL